MTLEKPAGTASKLGTRELLKEQPGIAAGSIWIARSADDAGESPKLFSVLRVHKHLSKKPEAVEAFVTDTSAAMGFTHPNASALVAVGNEAGELYLAVDHHEGETLAALIAAAGPSGLPQPVVLRVAIDLLTGLAAAHGADPPLVHGELGPQQVLVGEDGTSRVAGLVSARTLSRLAPPTGAKNHDRLSYAAPERVKTLSLPTSPPPDPRADVFSVAVILWEAIARQRLFTSKIEAAIVQKVLTAPIAALGSLPGITVSAPLAAAVHKALERDPAKRTQSAGELLAELEALGPEAIATPKQVAAEVERLAGKAIATRKTDLRAEITRRANKGSSTIPPPAAPRAGAGLPRKATLLGIAAIKPAAVPNIGQPATAAEPSPKPVAVKPIEAKPAVTVAEAPKPAVTVTETPKPAVTMGETPKPPAQPALDIPLPRPPAESLNLDEIEVVATPPKAPPAPSAASKRATLLMGAVGDIPKPEETAGAAAEAPKPTGAAAATPKPAVTKGETPKPVAAAAETSKPAAQPAPASARSVATPKPAAAQALLVEGASGKTAPTPASDGPSPRSKSGVAIEKVGPGSTLGRYEILTPVARGGMASVWAARLPGSRGFQKIFAIKTMLPDVSDDPDFESMFLDEGRVAARIRHPNVVEIIDLGEQEDVLYLVMEWVEGENLGALVKAARGHGGVPMPIILRIASQICSGLHAAHELRDDDGNLLDLVHRDISPANVLVSTSGFVKIVDFGIAKSKGRLHVTRVGGMVKGKTPYLSPEQLGQQPIDRRSDIFSFGVLLYVLATGLHPFRGETDSKTIENIALREPVPLRALVAAIPAEFEALVLKALAKDPKDRFGTAGEMHRALDHVAASLGFTTTEEDIAAFVRKALGETLAKRAQELRSAVERADTSGARSAAEASMPLDALPPPPPLAAATPEAVEAKPPIEEEVSFESASAPAAPAAIAPAAAGLPRSRQPEAVTLPEIPPPTPESLVAAAPPDSRDEPTSRPVTRSESDETTVEVQGLPPRRKPLAMFAVGGVLGLCAVVGGIALLTGGKKDPSAGPGSTAAVAVSPVPSTPQAATLAPTATEAPVAAKTAAPPETAAPTQAAPSTTAEAAPPDTAAPPAVPVRGGKLSKTPGVVRPNPAPRARPSPRNPTTPARSERIR